MAKQIHLVLVHGTGNQKPSTSDTPHWWESSSEFAQQLAVALSNEKIKVVVDPPFMWGGDNSETVRRNAGRSLEAHLNELERRGCGYYLIGHSHGGSVIWGALARSMLPGHRRLSGLRRWATIGTPFLQFKPDFASLWPTIPAALSGIALYGLGASVSELWTSVTGAVTYTQDATPLWGLLILNLVLGAISTWGVWAVTSLGVALARYAVRSRLEVLAFDAYGQVGTHFHHPDDEPINGLAASTIAPAEIAPRPIVDPARPVWERTWLALRRGIAQIYAPLIDQIIWDALVRSLQGDDLPNERMASVSRWPVTTAIKSMGYSAPDLLAHSEFADSKAVNIATNTRDLLRNLGSGEIDKLDAKTLTKIIDWSGIIHTSYFDMSSTGKRLAEGVLTTAPHPVMSVSPAARSAYRPWRMTGSFAALTTAFVGGVWAISALMTGLFVRPYSMDDLLARFAGQYSNPLLSTVVDSDLPGQLLVKLFTAPMFGIDAHAESPGRILRQLGDLNSRYRSAAVFVSSLANPRTGDMAPVDEFLDEYLPVGDTSPSELGALQRDLLELYALDAISSDNQLEIDDHKSRFERLASRLGALHSVSDRPVDLARLIVVAGKLGVPEVARPFETALLSSHYNCEVREQLAIGLLHLGNIDDAADLADNCSALLLSKAILTLVADKRDSQNPEAELAGLSKTNLGPASLALAKAKSGQPLSVADVKASMALRLLGIGRMLKTNNYDSAIDEIEAIEALLTPDTNGILRLHDTAWENIGWYLGGAGERATDTWLHMSELLIEEYRDALTSHQGRFVSAEVAENAARMMLDIASDEALLDFAVQLEATASATASGTAANRSVATLIYDRLRGEWRSDAEVSASLRSALDAIRLSEVDMPEYLVRLAELAARLGDDENLRLALSLATAQAERTQDFYERASYLSRLAVLQVNRGNYPEGIRLIDTTALPIERFKSLVSAYGQIFEVLAGEDSSEVRWTADPLAVATTLLIDSSSSSEVGQ